MGAERRVSVAPVDAEAPIASEHVHRHRLAASLCEGLRVADLAEADIDPVEFLARDLGSDYDALVCVEGIERFDDPASVLDGMVRHAGSGMGLVVSLPRSNWKYEDALATFERCDEVTVLFQFAAEGSLIRGAEPSELVPEFVLHEHGEVEWASHFIACVNLDGRVRELGDSAQMKLAVAPHYASRIEALERANRELWRENTRIGRERIGSGGAGAAMARERVRELEERVQELERVLAAPHHQSLERARDRIRGRPALDRAARAIGAWLHRR